MFKRTEEISRNCIKGISMFPSLVDPLQAKILEWLRSGDEDRAVDWFLSGWTGHNKRWMLANLGYGMVSSKNGQESSHHNSSDTASGSSGNVKLLHFLSISTMYMAVRDWRRTQ